MFNIPAVARNLYRHRELIRILSWRDYQARYRGSLGGILWSIAQPLLMMVVYTLVFSTFLKVRFGSNDSPYTFAVYLLCGLLPWNAFAEGLNLSTTLIRGNINMVKRVVFPLEILPVNITLVAIFQQIIGFALLIPLIWLILGKLSWVMLLLPLVLVLELVLFTGINWIWSALSVFIPDLRQITPLITSILIFITPIFYPEDFIPDWAAWVVKINPMAHLISLFRNVLLEGALPQGGGVAWFVAACVGLCLLGYRWYMSSKQNFPDYL